MSAQAPNLGLGSAVKVFRSTSLNQVLLGLIIGLALMTAALALGIDWSAQSWTAFMCTIGILTVAASVVSLPGALRARRTRVTVYDLGVAVSEGKSHAIVRWEDIAGTWQQYIHGTKGRVRRGPFIVQGLGGAWLSFNPDRIARGRELALYIQQRSHEHLLPAYWANFNSGHTLSFGPVQLSRAGLTIQDKTLPWDQVKSARVNSWYFAVNEKGLQSWATAETSQIPNPGVLLVLIDRITGGTAKVSLPQPVRL